MSVVRAVEPVPVFLEPGEGRVFLGIDPDKGVEPEVTTWVPFSEVPEGLVAAMRRIWDELGGNALVHLAMECDPVDGDGFTIRAARREDRR